MDNVALLSFTVYRIIIRKKSSLKKNSQKSMCGAVIYFISELYR